MAGDSVSPQQQAHSGSSSSSSEPCKRGEEAVSRSERVVAGGAASAQITPAEALDWKEGGSSGVAAVSERDAVLEWALSCEHGLGMGDHCSWVIA